MITSAPLRKACSWGPIPTPPNTDAAVIGVCTARSFRSSRICAASSRVGVITSARVVPRGRSISLWRMGSRNAAVLPLPVMAQASTSRPAIAGGIASAWIGVGRVKPSSLMPFWRFGCSFKPVNGTRNPLGVVWRRQPPSTGFNKAARWTAGKARILRSELEPDPNPEEQIVHHATAIVAQQAGELETELQLSKLGPQRRRQRSGDASVGWIGSTDEARTVVPLELIPAGAKASAELEVRPSPDSDQYLRQPCEQLAVVLLRERNCPPGSKRHG